MPKTLARRVFAAGQWWEAGVDVPDDVAATLRNPAVWSTDDDNTDETGPAPRRADGPRLATRVVVDGAWYGPDDDIPEDVARRLTNPRVWEGGDMPTFATTAGGSTASTDGGSGDGATGAQPEGGKSRVPAPARSGKGSGKDAWAAFLGASGVEYDADASREDLIAAAERAGLVDKE